MEVFGNSKATFYLGIIVSAYVSCKLAHRWGWMTYRYFQGRKKIKQEVQKPVPKLMNVSQDLEQFVLSLSASQISEAIKTKRIKAEEVMTIYIKRTIQEGRKNFLITEQFYEEALETAKQIDKMEVKPDLPLLGVPFSVKDEYQMKGSCTSIGCVWRAFTVDEKDCLHVQILREQGAIPFVKTNLCQCVYWVESECFYGRISNVYDNNRTSGGSSGGCAGMVGRKLSQFSLGTDYGGSIRIPANFNGLAGYKISPLRHSLQGIPDITENQICDDKISSAGVLTRHVDEAVQVISAWLQNQSQFDPNCPHMPFEWNLYKSIINGNKKLKIGFFTDDNFMTPCPSIIRAVQEAKQLLEQQGHTLIPMDIKLAGDCFDLFAKISTGNPNHLKDALKGESPAPYFLLEDYIRNVPGFSFILQLIAKFILRDEETAQSICQVKEVPKILDIRKTKNKIDQVKTQFYAYLKELDLDAYICPLAAIVAPIHLNTLNLVHAFSYSWMSSLLQLSCGTVNITYVKPEEQYYQSKKNTYTTQVAQSNMENSQGLPVGIQVCAAPFKDEICLAVMKILQEACGADNELRWLVANILYQYHLN